MPPIRVTVLSGKGGTGKTTVAVSLALSIPNAQLLDCDVDAPNAHLFLDAEELEEEAVHSMVPVLDAKRCDGCRDLDVPVCREVCAFHSLAVVKGTVLLFPELCHGCSACVDLCPRGAFTEGRKQVGVVSEGRAGELRLVTGSLRIGEPSAVAVIRAVKRKIDPARPAILDASPGVACPVVTTLEGSDAALLVTEPTPFGLHDLRLAAYLCRELGVPAGVVLNRADLGDSGVRAWLEGAGLPLLLEIPFDRELAEAGARGRPLVAVRPELRPRLRAVYEELVGLAAGTAVTA